MKVFSTVIIINYCCCPLKVWVLHEDNELHAVLRVHVRLLFELWEMKSHSHLIYFLDKIKSLE